MTEKTKAPVPQKPAPPSGKRSLLQRACACGQHTPGGAQCDDCRKKRDGMVQRAPLNHSFSPRKAGNQEEGGVPGVVHDVLRSPGQSLDAVTKADLEPRFGYDFSHVKVHADGKAAESAQSMNAQAYTVGGDIVFGAGQYAPQTSAGRRLLAHELTHVVQQDKNAPAEEGEIEIGKPGDRFEQEADKAAEHVFRSVLQLTPGGIVQNRLYNSVIQRQDRPATTTRSEAPRPRQEQARRRAEPRTLRIPWRGSIRESIFQFLTSFNTPPDEAARVTRLVLDSVTGYLSGSEQITRNQFEQRTTQFFVLDSGLTEIIMSELGITPERLQVRAEVAEATEVIRGLARDVTEPGIPGETQEERRQTARGAPVEANWRVMESNAPLSQRYLLQMQHFAGLRMTGEIRSMANDGLTLQELRQIVGDNGLLRHYTNLFTQGFSEFLAARGTDIERFAPLMERILEQFGWGNPTAVQNQLRIGYGESWVPAERQMLGIAHRTQRWLLYDSQGMPLRSAAGGMFRDEGFVSTRPPEFGINIANIEDPAIRGLLNQLRQQIGDPNRMLYHAAEVYMDNVELVKARVMEGLPAETIQRFEDGLPMFVGFLAGHALSVLLLRAPNPVLVAIGGILRGLLTAAGYALEIDFAASAIERLYQAATPLSRVVKDADGQLSELSQHYLAQAAMPLRSMVADIAILATTVGMARLLGAIRGRRSGETPRIECHSCTIAEPGAPTVEAPRAGEAPRAAEAPRPGETPGAPRAEAPGAPRAETPAPGEAPAAPRVEPPRTGEPPAQPQGGRGPARTVAEQVAEAQQRPADQSVRQLENLLEPRQVRLRELNLSIERLSRRITQLLEQRANARGAERARLSREVEGLQRTRDQLQAEREPLGREAGEINRALDTARLRLNPHPRHTLPCFAADTMVWTASGPCPIKLIHPGDQVYAYDQEQGEVTLRSVLEVHHNLTVLFYEITVAGTTIRATRRHRFWVADQCKWLAAQDLQINMQLLTLAGACAPITHILQLEVPETSTYNLSVETDRNFFVGAGVLAHNETPGVVQYNFGPSIVYEGINPNFPGEVYIGQTNDLAVRIRDHRAEAFEALRNPNLTPEQRRFFEFKQNMELRPRVVGLDANQATYLEQRNFDLERQLRGRENVRNRINAADEGRMRELRDLIARDPRVRAQGYC